MKISDILLALYIATVFGVAVFSIMRRAAVRRTPMHYVAKTWLIIMVVLHILLLLVNVIVIVRETDAVIEQAFYIVYAIIMGSLFTKAVIDILKDDDDDWFNDRWKKIKGWITKSSSSRRFKPASVT